MGTKIKGLRTISTVGGAMLIALCWAIPAGADSIDFDINAAGWVDDAAPRSLYAEWGATSLTPGLHVADTWSSVASPNPLEPLYSDGLLLPGVSVSGLPPKPSSPFPNMQFWLPNFVDSMPLKKVRIQVVFSTTSDTAVPLIMGVDGGALGEAHPCSVGCFGELTYASELQPLVGDSWYFYEDWEIVPNPWYETVNLQVPNGVSMEGVVIETLSTVPVPPAVWLLGSALLGLFAVGRRRGPAAQC